MKHRSQKASQLATTHKTQTPAFPLNPRPTDPDDLWLPSFTLTLAQQREAYDYLSTLPKDELFTIPPIQVSFELENLNENGHIMCRVARITHKKQNILVECVKFPQCGGTRIGALFTFPRDINPKGSDVQWAIDGLEDASETVKKHWQQSAFIEAQSVIGFVVKHLAEF